MKQILDIILVRYVQGSSVCISRPKLPSYDMKPIANVRNASDNVRAAAVPSRARHAGLKILEYRSKYADSCLC
jgi:hypothetical protein